MQPTLLETLYGYPERIRDVDGGTVNDEAEADSLYQPSDEVWVKPPSV